MYSTHNLVQICMYVCTYVQDLGCGRTRAILEMHLLCCPAGRHPARADCLCMYILCIVCDVALIGIIRPIARPEGAPGASFYFSRRNPGEGKGGGKGARRIRIESKLLAFVHPALPPRTGACNSVSQGLQSIAWAGDLVQKSMPDWRPACEPCLLLTPESVQNSQLKFIPIFLCVSTCLYVHREGKVACCALLHNVPGLGARKDVHLIILKGALLFQEKPVVH